MFAWLHLTFVALALFIEHCTQLGSNFVAGIFSRNSPCGIHCHLLITCGFISWQFQNVETSAFHQFDVIGDILTPDVGHTICKVPSKLRFQPLL